MTIRITAVVVFLGAVVAANLITTHYAGIGHPEVSVYTAFGLIGLDMVTRDVLHDWWTGARRWILLGALIAAGSLLSYIANPDSATIAKASCAAFAAAFIVDSLVYEAARGREWMTRCNVSNIAAAAVDSVVFVWIAFPQFVFALAFGQFTAKVAGGVLFALALNQTRLAVARG